GPSRHVESLRKCGQPHGARKARRVDYRKAIAPGADAQQLSSLIGCADKAELLSNHPLNETARRCDRAFLWRVPIGSLSTRGKTVLLTYVISHANYLSRAASLTVCNIGDRTNSMTRRSPVLISADTCMPGRIGSSRPSTAIQS